MIERLPSDDPRRPYRLTDGGAAALKIDLDALRLLAATGPARLATA